MGTCTPVHMHTSRHSHLYVITSSKNLREDLPSGLHKGESLLAMEGRPPWKVSKENWDRLIDVLILRGEVMQLECCFGLSECYIRHKEKITDSQKHRL